MNRPGVGMDGSFVQLGEPFLSGDNAVAESFFATLTKELVHRKEWATHAELEAAVFEYIEVYYNRKRIHSSLGYRTPCDVENDFLINRHAA